MSTNTRGWALAALIWTIVITLMIRCSEKQSEEEDQRNADPTQCSPKTIVFDPHAIQGEVNFKAYCPNVAHQIKVEGVVISCTCSPTFERTLH